MTLPVLTIFLHIPKTAGLTLRHSLLPRQYPREAAYATPFTSLTSAEGARSVGVFDEDLGAYGLFSDMRRPGDLWYPKSLPAAADHLNHLPAERRAALRLIYGTHIEFGLHAYLAQPAQYFTLLRDPVERVLSHYYYARQERSVPPHQTLGQHIAALVEANLQTRLLAGANAPAAPAERLARATANLRACLVVGLTERFDETALLLKHALGWRGLPFYERRNVGRRRLPRTALPPEVIQQIEADNALDVALYAHARELFAAQLQTAGRRFPIELRLFRSLNAVWQRWHTVQRAGQTAGERHYQTLVKNGALRRLWPIKPAPRVVSTVRHNRLYFDLTLGSRTIGQYDPQRHAWRIARPYDLIIDPQTLPHLTAPDAPRPNP